MDLCEFKATLGYIRSMQKQNQVIMAHVFKPSTSELQTFIPSTRGNIKWEERGLVCLICGHPSLVKVKSSLVAWLLCFSGFWVEPQYLSLEFY